VLRSLGKPQAIGHVELFSGTAESVLVRHVAPLSADDQWDNCFEHVTDEQLAQLRAADRVVMLGGKVYADAAEVLLGRPVERPLAGLGIGEQLAWYCNASPVETKPKKYKRKASNVGTIDGNIEADRSGQEDREALICGGPQSGNLF
jgi:hypothetical protein